MWRRAQAEGRVVILFPHEYLPSLVSRVHSVIASTGLRQREKILELEEASQKPNLNPQKTQKGSLRNVLCFSICHGLKVQPIFILSEIQTFLSLSTLLGVLLLVWGVFWVFVFVFIGFFCFCFLASSQNNPTPAAKLVKTWGRRRCKKYSPIISKLLGFNF